MKTFKIFSVTVIFLSLVNISSAQKNQKESFRVSGNCEMCKAKIEKAAKTAGASYAEWNVDTKILAVKYSAAATDVMKIQQKIAETGYDTPEFKATAESYNKLPKCCRYERVNAAKAACCDNEKCGKEENCCKDKECCEEGKCKKSNS